MQQKQKKEKESRSVSITCQFVALVKSLKIVRRDLPELWVVLMLGLVAPIIGVIVFIWSLVLGLSPYVALAVVFCLFAILITARFPSTRKIVESVLKFLNSLF